MLFLPFLPLPFLPLPFFPLPFLPPFFPFFFFFFGGVEGVDGSEEVSSSVEVGDSSVVGDGSVPGVDLPYEECAILERCRATMSTVPAVDGSVGVGAAVGAAVGDGSEVGAGSPDATTRKKSKAAVPLFWPVFRKPTPRGLPTAAEPSPTVKLARSLVQIVGHPFLVSERFSSSTHSTLRRPAREALRGVRRHLTPPSHCQHLIVNVLSASQSNFAEPRNTRNTRSTGSAQS